MKKIIFLILAAVFSAGCSFVNTSNGHIDADDDVFAFVDDDIADLSDELTDPDDNSTPDDTVTPDEVVIPDEAVTPDESVTPDEDIESPEKVVIATYNTHMFFDTVCDSGSCASSDFEEQPSVSEYNDKVADVAEALTMINADIVLLQEVEKKICLEDLFDEMNGVYDDLYIGETGYDASIDTAVITKGEITYTNKHTGSIPHPDGGTTTFTRAFLEAHINLGGRKIIVFSAHFKAKSNDDPERRQAEADAALEIINDVADSNSDALIVMGGDLNDTPGSGPVSTLENSSELVRVASELSSTDQATYYYDGPIAIDHIFFCVEGSGSYVSKSAEVIKDAPSWYSLISSDHAALKAEFEF